MSYYLLIPEAVYQITSCSTRKTKTFETSIASFSYRSVKNSMFFGYELKNNILIASPEKALLDWLYFRYSFDRNDFMEMRFNIEVMQKIVDDDKVLIFLSVIKSSALERRYGIFVEAMNHA